MYSFFSLFFLIPLYFSHVLFPLGIFFDTYSFERQKVYLFFFLLCCICIEYLLFSRKQLFSGLIQYWRWILLFLLLPLFSWIAASTHGFADIFLFGTPEKQHGYFFYAGCVLLSFFLLISPHKFLKQYLCLSVFVASIVALIAVGESVGGVLDLYERTQEIRLYGNRVVSTLGNPNYLAGYLLMVIPLVFLFSSRLVISLLLVLFTVTILLTGSYIGIALLCCYFLFLTYKRIPIYYRIYLLLFSSLFIFIGYLYIDHTKFLSLMSRFILMEDIILAFFNSPLVFFFGSGPDGVIVHFFFEKSSQVLLYFPDDSLIDSSHNIFLDLLFQYGSLFFICIGYLWRKCDVSLSLDAYSTTSMVLGLIFFSFNVPVVVHILLFLTTFSFAIHKKPSYL